MSSSSQDTNEYDVPLEDRIRLICAVQESMEHELAGLKTRIRAVQESIVALNRCIEAVSDRLDRHLRDPRPGDVLPEWDVDPQEPNRDNGCSP